MSVNGQMPLVSIIITSYNRARWIEKAIESALVQDYPWLEVVISDNDSTDDTDEVIRKYLDDPRIRYSKNASNIGMFDNFKKATNELAKGDYILYVSSDDHLYDPEFISASMNLIEKNPAVRLVFGKLATFNAFAGEKLTFYKSDLWEKSVWKGSDVFFRFPANGFLSFGGCLMTRKDLVNLEVFEMRHVNFDVECILKIMLLGDVGFVDKDTYVFVRHDGNQSGSMNLETQVNKLNYIEEVFNYAKKILGETHYARLTDWKDQVLNITIKSCLYFLKMHNYTVFKKFFDHIKENYPENLKTMNKDLSWYTKIRMNKKVLLFLYKHLKPSYYYQEFASAADRSLQAANEKKLKEPEN